MATANITQHSAARIDPRSIGSILLKLAAIIVIAVASRIWVYEISYALTPHEGRPPLILGIGFVLGLVGGFGFVFWWLYFSPLKATVEAINTDVARRRRRFVGTALLVGASVFIIGGMLDTLWHIWLGGFGDDFLWPPHMLLYTSFLINTIVAGFFLGRIMLGKGDPRVRARQEPALGAAALASAYLIGSLPSDLIWHQIYGIDITPWSLPHLLLVTMTVVGMVGAAQLLLTSLKPGETSRWVRIGVLLAVSCMTFGPLLIITPEYEFGRASSISAVVLRPAWVYPFMVYLVGLTISILITSLLKGRWNATTVALIGFAGRAAMLLGAFTLPIERTMRIGANLFLTVPAIAIDLAFVWLSRNPTLSVRQRILWAGLIYSIAYWPAAILAIFALNIGIPFTLSDAVVGIAFGLVYLVLFAVEIPVLARWLRNDGSGKVDMTSEALPAEQPTDQPESNFARASASESMA